MRLNNTLPPIGLAIASLMIWEGICRLFDVQQFLLPTPSQIIFVIGQDFVDLLKNASITLYEALLGFTIANIVAISLSVCMVYIANLNKAVMPLAIGLKTTPIVAMAPLLLLWFGTGLAPKIAASALICFFPSLVNSIKGFHSLQEGEEDLFKIYGASKTQILLKLRFRRAAPYIFSALKVSSSLAIVGAIIGEFVGANSGIGYVILTSSYHLETAKMFAALVITAMVGFCFYYFIDYLDQKFVFWMDYSSDEIRLESPPRNKTGEKP